MEIKIVNIHHNNQYDVYIGRKGHGLDGYFGNPHSVYMGTSWTECKICEKLHNREESLKMYIEYFYKRINTDKEFLQKIESLKGKILGCFCRPKNGFNGKLLCHGQIIAGYLYNIDPKLIE